MAQLWQKEGADDLNELQHQDCDGYGDDFVQSLTDGLCQFGKAALVTSKGNEIL